MFHQCCLSNLKCKVAKIKYVSFRNSTLHFNFLCVLFYESITVRIKCVNVKISFVFLLFRMEHNIRQIKQVFKSLKLQTGIRSSDGKEMSRKGENFSIKIIPQNSENFCVLYYNVLYKLRIERKSHSLFLNIKLFQSMYPAPV